MLCVRECSFAMVSNVDRTMVDANLWRFSIDVSHCKIIEDFPRLLNSVGKSRIGEEEGTCTIHKFLPFIQQLWHLIAIHPNSCCIVKLFHTVMKNCIYLWETTWKPNVFALRAIGGCKSNRSTVMHSYVFTAYLSLSSLPASWLFEAAWK